VLGAGLLAAQRPHLGVGGVQVVVQADDLPIQDEAASQKNNHERAGEHGKQAD
jgi:hypothetical protein